MRIVTLFLSLILFGCQSTTGNSNFAPSITNVSIEKVAVMVPDSLTLENKLVKELGKLSKPAMPMRNVAAFAKDAEGLRKMLVDEGVSHVLLLNGNIGQQDTRYAGSITNTTTNLWSTTPYSATASTNSFSTPLYASSNYAQSYGRLFSVDGTLLWITNISIEAQGAVYTGQNAMEEGVVEGVVEEMKKGGLL